MTTQLFLKAARNQKRFTALEMGNAAGISEGRYFRIETGRTLPTPEECAKLADFLGYTVELLFPDVPGVGDAKP